MVSLPRRPLRLLLAVVLGALVLLGGWLILRDSSLVRVRQVEVVGVQGRQADEIRDVLESAARDMTTLHVRSDELLKAAEAYPVVKSVRTQAHLLHRLRIVVNAYEPVVALESGSRREAVAADGTILRGAATQGLPRLKLETLDGGRRVSSASTRRAVRLLGAAPPALRGRVQRVFQSRRGLSTTMRDGPKLYFGGGDRFAAKWAAAAQVLGDSSASGASYVDVRLPGRPTAGGLPPLPPEPKPAGIPETPEPPPPTAAAPIG